MLTAHVNNVTAASLVKSGSLAEKTNSVLWKSRRWVMLKKNCNIRQRMGVVERDVWWVFTLYWKVLLVDWKFVTVTHLWVGNSLFDNLWMFCPIKSFQPKFISAHEYSYSIQKIQHMYMSILSTTFIRVYVYICVWRATALLVVWEGNSLLYWCTVFFYPLMISFLFGKRLCWIQSTVDVRTWSFTTNCVPSVQEWHSLRFL